MQAKKLRGEKATVTLHHEIINSLTVEKPISYKFSECLTNFIVAYMLLSPLIERG